MSEIAKVTKGGRTCSYVAHGLRAHEAASLSFPGQPNLHHARLVGRLQNAALIMRERERV